MQDHCPLRRPSQDERRTVLSCDTRGCVIRNRRMRFASAAIIAIATLAACGTPTARPNALVEARQDGFPLLNVDACWWINDGFSVVFDSGSADASRNDRRLDEIARLMRRYGGDVLVEAHLDGAEVARPESRDLDRRRAEGVRDELVRRGVSAERVWLRVRGFERPTVPTSHGTAELQNRRARILLPLWAPGCVATHQHRQLDWLRENCLGLDAVVRREGCASSIEEIRKLLPVPRPEAQAR